MTNMISVATGFQSSVNIAYDMNDDGKLKNYIPTKSALSLLEDVLLSTSQMSFAFIRGGHIDAAVLGTLQVDQEGNIANWTIPGKMVPGMGGAMDLCAGVKKIIVATDHCEKSGKSKILKKCTLPLTGVHCVTDIVTERCYFEVTKDGLVLRELAEEYSVEDILACTEADVIVPDEIGVMS